MKLETPPEGSGRLWKGGSGGAEGDRTLDLRDANATLSQLSYRPMISPRILAPEDGVATNNRRARPYNARPHFERWP